MENLIELLPKYLYSMVVIMHNIICMQKNIMNFTQRSKESVSKKIYLMELR